MTITLWTNHGETNIIKVNLGSNPSWVLITKKPDKEAKTSTISESYAKTIVQEENLKQQAINPLSIH